MSTLVRGRTTLMKRIFLPVAAAAAIVAAHPGAGSAQKNVTLHINTRWDECAFQLDPALTQDAWRRFTEEAGLVAYLRPLTDARPLGRGHFEMSLLSWGTAIDDTAPAWNDTFVHPHETHWLIDGSRLSFPGVQVRAGVTDRIDVGGYLTKNPNSNYGFWGGQIQYAILYDETSGWAVAGRMSAVSLYGPEDLDLAVYGLDFVASRAFPVASWVTLSPYAGVSSYASRSHEKSPVVQLEDEWGTGSQAMLGAEARISRARLALEFSTARVNTRSFKVGVAF
jgi:hypothetical protein